MYTCYYCNQDYRSTYQYDSGFHMNVCLLGMRRDDVDSHDNNVCESCMIFVDQNSDTCAMCAKEFNSIDSFKEHVLQNKIRCNLCQEFISDIDISYCVDPDHVYMCEICNKGYLTKRAH